MILLFRPHELRVWHLFACRNHEALESRCCPLQSWTCSQLSHSLTMHPPNWRHAVLHHVVAVAVLVSLLAFVLSSPCGGEQGWCPHELLCSSSCCCCLLVPAMLLWLLLVLLQWCCCIAALFVVVAGGCGGWWSSSSICCVVLCKVASCSSCCPSFELHLLSLHGWDGALVEQECCCCHNIVTMASEKGHKLFMDKQARSKRKCLSRTKKQGKKKTSKSARLLHFCRKNTLVGAGDQTQASRVFFLQYALQDNTTGDRQTVLWASYEL